MHYFRCSSVSISSEKYQQTSIYIPNRSAPKNKSESSI
ncbi:hypothetical protein TSAR_006671 [Trichomalopsis sarcophagae]|uniref:Uncharacterized protein n=1 Tax=Trichomalopsis sarcophagae TaxID=543379 RepID=A0A232EH97_9HYME|nr:hypothetical protein TSAR_006671 [Trichomalopsis sarcophagae]